MSKEIPQNIKQMNNLEKDEKSINNKDIDDDNRNGIIVPDNEETYDDMYKKYIVKYGNFSHILNIEIDKSLSEDEKNIILYDIYDLINEKEIEKNISNMNVIIKWRVYDKSNLLHYYTGGDGILGDIAIYEHTKLLLTDINKLKNSDKIKIYLNKPLTKSICMLNKII
jgi:hypothetical protein